MRWRWGFCALGCLLDCALAGVQVVALLSAGGTPENEGKITIRFS